MVDFQYQKLGLPGEKWRSQSWAKKKYKIIMDALVYGSPQGPFEMKSESILKEILLTKSSAF